MTQEQLLGIMVATLIAGLGYTNPTDIQLGNIVQLAKRIMDRVDRE